MCSQYLNLGCVCTMSTSLVVCTVNAQVCVCDHFEYEQDCHWGVISRTSCSGHGFLSHHSGLDFSLTIAVVKWILTIQFVRSASHRQSLQSPSHFYTHTQQPNMHRTRYFSKEVKTRNVSSRPREVFATHINETDS